LASKLKDLYIQWQIQPESEERAISLPFFFLPLLLPFFFILSSKVEENSLSSSFFLINK
jgi:hypothetical protein